jgi:hypothetical protein
VDRQDYSGVAQGDVLELDVKSLEKSLCVKNTSKGSRIKVDLSLSAVEKNIIKAGGKLAAIKARHARKYLST